MTWRGTRIILKMMFIRRLVNKGEIGQTYRFMLKEDTTAKSYERFSQTAMPRRVTRGGSVVNINEDLEKIGLYPTKIGHLEKLVRFTGPNHRNMGGGRTCKRESCVNNNALLSPKFQTFFDSTNKSAKELLDEENLMHQLQVFYKKNTDFDYSIVNKSALESNMFSNKRITLEGMIRAKSENKNLSALTNREIEVINLLHNDDKSSLRKNDLGEPTNRREVELLGSWLDKMLNDYVFSK